MKKVIVEVSGGVAEATLVPSDTEVSIIDWDEYSADRNSFLSRLSLEELDWIGLVYPEVDLSPLKESS